ncbi:MAG: VCBS repeat-containing protein [Thermoplasmata archaeon]|nr:MAG: VCBS repeat-containing protein [Thermoplasmata archaeon]
MKIRSQNRETHKYAKVRLLLALAVGLSLALTAFILPSQLASAEVPPEALNSGIGRFNSIICADVDGDTRDEILFGSFEGYVVSVEFQGGDYFVDWISPQFGERCWGITSGQFDSDSAQEIIIGDGDGVVRAVDGVTKDTEWTSETLVRDAHGLLLHDVDDDGDNELIVGTGYKTDQGWGQIYLFDQEDSDYYDAFEPFDSRLRELDVKDVDNDGEEELIVGCGVSLGDIAGEGYVRVFDLQTKALEWRSPDLGGCVEGLRVTDLDSDGTLEIVVSNGYRYREGFCFIYHYEEGEYRRVWKSKNIGPKAYGLDVGDIDEDGVAEIVISNLAGYIYVFDGETHAEEWRSGNLGRDILGITLGDPDGDGETEIIAGQGGYIGKGDYTSGYVTPHVYIIDGKTHQIEAVLGEIDEVLQWVQVGILVAVVIGLVETGIIVRLRTRPTKRTSGRA